VMTTVRHLYQSSHISVDNFGIDCICRVFGFAGSKDGCDNPCWNNVVSQATCCDDIYVPSFTFTNDYGFTQDRQVVSEIYLGPDGEVLRGVQVLGMYYQPMTFENFPFESMDLIIAVRNTLDESLKGGRLLIGCRLYRLNF